MLARWKKDARTRGLAFRAAVDAMAKKKPRNKAFRLVECTPATDNLLGVGVARENENSFTEVQRRERVKVFSLGSDLWVKKRGNGLC
jgi:hypothetical protein